VSWGCGWKGGAGDAPRSRSEGKVIDQKGIVHEIVSTDPDEGGKIGQTIVSENSCKCIADPP